MSIGYETGNALLKAILVATLFFSSGLVVAAEEHVTDGLSVLSETDVEQELLAAPQKVKKAALESKNKLASLVSPALMDIRIEAAAHAVGFENREDIKAAVHRSIRNTISRLYIEEEIEKATRKLETENLDKLAYERYLTEKEQFRVPESIRVAHILLHVDPESETDSDEVVRAKAQTVLDELKKGVDFKTLVEKYSDDKATNKKGGELPGWLAKGSLVPPFEKVAYLLKPGETSGLVRTRFGYHFIKLLEHRDSFVESFDKVKNTLVSRVRSELENSIRADVIAKYRSNDAVYIPDQVFNNMQNKFKMPAAETQSK